MAVKLQKKVTIARLSQYNNQGGGPMKYGSGVSLIGKSGLLARLISVRANGILQPEVVVCTDKEVSRGNFNNKYNCKNIFIIKE